jgi:hypothetical protein
MRIAKILRNRRSWAAILLGFLLVALVVQPAGVGILLAIVLVPVLLLGLVRSFGLAPELPPSVASAVFLGPGNFQRPPPFLLL